MSPSPRRLAAAVSTLGHPFVLVPLAVLLAGRRTLPADQLTLVTGVLVVSLLLESAYIVHRVRSGQWTDVDVSVRAQRPRLFLSAMLLAALSLLFLWRSGLPVTVLRGIGAAIALLGAAMLCNLRLKVSLHVAFDVYAALLASWGSPLLAAPLLAVAALVGWSRLALRRHTLPEVLAGGLLGALAGAAAAWRG